MRLDQYLVENGHTDSRERAKRLIVAGRVRLDGKVISKPAFSVEGAPEIEVEQESFVGRGGEKLQGALNAFGVDPKGMRALDVGASTGGFTDCMLQNGAVKVYSVDVGYGQLAWKLRIDERVVNMERTNIRYVTSETIGEELDFASIDVSFISLKLVLPVAFELLKDGGELVALIKPQFEAGKEKVGKKGVVRDPEVHREVIETVTKFAQNNGFNVLGLEFSPIRGPEGNIEYLMYARKEKLSKMRSFADEIFALVDRSHLEAK